MDRPTTDLYLQRRETIRTVLLMITGSPNPSLIEKARALVPAAKNMAISSFVQFTQDEPCLGEVTPHDWDWFLTVATVFVVLTDLAAKGLGPIEDEITDIVSDAMSEWSGNAAAGFEDCKAFYEKVYGSLVDANRNESNFVSSYAVGLWAEWNLLGKQPDTVDERRIALALGVLSHSLLGYWD